MELKITDEIYNQVSDVLEWSQNLDKSDGVEGLLNDWAKNKQRLYEDIFNNQLIYEYPTPITFTLDEKTKNHYLNDFIDVVDGYYNNSALADFVEAERDGFFENIVHTPYKNNNTMIKSGSKLLKSFKYFESNKEVLDNIQTRASMLIQENKATGKLCFSIHPLDYLSVSENTYNWRSCHALDGEYRAGNLEYMTDPTTIVCYLKGADNIQLPMFPESVLWNSKKWRMLLFVNKNQNIVFAGRQYPFQSEQPLDIIKDIMIAKDSDWQWSKWQNDLINREDVKELTNPYYLLGDSLVSSRVAIQEKSSSFYNDLWYSSFYTPYYIYKNKPKTSFNFYDDVENNTTYIGNPCNCIRCGRKPFANSECMICEQCNDILEDTDNEDYIICERCDRTVYAGSYDYDNADYVEGDLICGSCIDSSCQECEVCGKLKYKQHLKYDRGQNKVTCFECYLGPEIFEEEN